MKRRPGRTLLVTCGVLLIGGIGVNALFLQNERHPAPFFRTAKSPATDAQQSVPLPPARPAEPAQRAQQKPQTQTTASVPVAPERPSSSAAEQRANATAVARAPAREPASQPAQQPASARHDQIAALLRDGRPSAPTPPASIPNASAEQTKRIVAVQEALKKLGHNIKPDGVAGPSTRVAIESFERTQKWQVTGQMSPKVLKELASRSGVRIP